jgi:ATP-dependent Clp protease protease subunit
MPSIRFIAVAALLFPASLLPQSQSAKNQAVIINFVLPIDSNTTNALLHAVNDQIRNGTQKITILISSPGGDTPSALAAYNILRNMPVEITTFNIGNVDSAAMLLYCAGHNRYSMPGPGTRFLIHGNAMTLSAGVPFSVSILDAQIQQLKSLNQMVVQVLSSIATGKKTEIENAIQSQQILTPEQAKEWGIVQDIKTNFMEPGATLVSVSNGPQAVEEVPIKYSSITQ